MKKTLFKFLLITLTLLAFNSSISAHGDMEPQHGGIVKVEHEIIFELVRRESDVSVYLRDHGKPYPTDKVTGNIIVLAGGKKSDLKLTPAGDNKMTASIKIPDGAKVLVKIKEDNHHSVTVRFAF